MKQPAVLFTVCLLIIALVGCHQKEKRAKQYHDTILQSVQAVIDSSLDYGDGVQSYEKTRALQAHERYSTLINQTLSKVETLKDFEGDTTMEVFSKELLGFYRKTLDTELNPFLQAIKGDAFNEQEMHSADSLMSKFAMDENKYWERFNWAEKKFYKEEGLAKIEK